jgi:hypothetical protein
MSTDPLVFDYDFVSWGWIDVANEHEDWDDVNQTYANWDELRALQKVVLPTGDATAPYDHRVRIAGGTPPYTVDLIHGDLPAYLGLINNVLTGTLETDGYYSFRLRVTDSASATYEALFTMEVRPAPPPPPPPPPPPVPPPILRLAFDGGPELVLSKAHGEPGLEMLHITEVDYGFPEPREILDPRPQADGTIDQTEHFGTRVVTLTGKVAIDWNSQGRRQRAMDALAPFLRPNVRPWLYSRFDDGQVRRMLVRADQYSRPQIANVQDLSISFKSATGVLEDEVAAVVRMIPEVPVAGREYDLEFDREYPPGTGTAWLATNEGNAPADWTATIFGPCEGPAIVNVTTDEAVDLAGLSLNAEQFVVVSSRDHTVLADGLVGSSRWHTVDYVATTWWQLMPGTSALRFHCHWWEEPSNVLFSWRHSNLL